MTMNNGYCYKMAKCLTNEEDDACEAQCISSNVYNKKSYKLEFLDTSLCYTKTPEEEIEEQRQIGLAVNFLASYGVQVKSDDGFYYRNIWNVLKELGAELAKREKELDISCTIRGIKNFGRQYKCDFPDPAELNAVLSAGEIAIVTDINTLYRYVLFAGTDSWLLVSSEDCF